MPGLFHINRTSYIVETNADNKLIKTMAKAKVQNISLG